MECPQDNYLVTPFLDVGRSVYYKCLYELYFILHQGGEERSLRSWSTQILHVITEP